MRIVLLFFTMLFVAAPSATEATERPDSQRQEMLQQNKIQRDGFNLYYNVIGDDGPFVVLLSGGPGADVRHMRPVAEELSRTHRAVLLEQRGTGRSRLDVYDAETVSLSAYVADLEALRIHLNKDHFILLGNSWGMGLALAYGVAHPEQTKAIITLGSGPLSMQHARAMRDNIQARLNTEERKTLDFWSAKFADDPETAFWEIMRIQWPVFFFDREKGRAVAAEFRPGDMNFQIMANSGLLLTAITEEVAPNLARISAPVLLIQGRQDPAPESNILDVANRLPNATLKFVHQCGHEPWSEQPDETWGYVRDFLAKLENE